MIGTFILYSKVIEKPILIKIIGPLSLISFCLAIGSHELNRQSFLYQCNLKAVLYLMISGLNSEGSIGFVFHTLVVFLVPLGLQLALMDYNPSATQDLIDQTAEESGYENVLVFVR